MDQMMKDNYQKLIRIIPDIETIQAARKLKAPGFMDLNVDLLIDNERYRYIALSHCYKHPSGDMVADPDMEIRIIKGQQMVEALAYQDMYQYQEVYDKSKQANERSKKALNEFLGIWLNNLIEQGHQCY